MAQQVQQLLMWSSHVGGRKCVDGVAADWYNQMERDFGLVPWLCFVEFVNLLFGPPIFAKSLGRIKALYRTGMEED
jgi:hypothetical protein